MEIIKKYKLFIVFLVFGIVFSLPTAFVKAEKEKQNNAFGNQINVSNNEKDVEDNEEADIEDNEEADIEDNDEGNGEQHRSRIANVVQELEKIANKDKGIGTEIKTVAQEEKDTSEKVKEKMDMINKRGGFKTFLIGSDYKNLGALRSELVTTQNHLDRLNKALEKATTDSVKADLETQIKELTSIKSEAEAFAEKMRNKFSLFGWLVKMFQ